MDEKHLWDYEHPYYMSEGCFYKGGNLENYESFSDFLESWKDNDVDLNRIHRWDFHRSEDSEGESTGPVHSLDLFYVMQRKAFTYSVHIKITEADEPAIKKFLEPHAKLNFKLWNGVL